MPARAATTALPVTDVPVVTLLYAPADRADLVGKALAGTADVVIIDLEDAVAPGSKDAARRGLSGLLSAREPGRPVQVRVNGLDTSWGSGDLAAVARLDPDVSVRVPKVQSAVDVDAVEARLEGDRPLHCLVESALGVERAFDISSHSSRVASIGLGEADLRSELGTNEDGLRWARSRIVIAARAAGLPPPAQSVYTALRDHAGLEASCRWGRELGFVGRCAIHPAQLPVIRAAYRPSEDEIRRSWEVVRLVEAEHSTGIGAHVLDDGTFVDAAMVRQAQSLLALAERTQE